MANNVIGIFSDEATARQVVDELTSAGFNQGDIRTFNGDNATLERELLDAGISQAEAKQHLAEVEGDGAAVMLQTDEAHTDKAVEIMSRYYTTVDSSTRTTTDVERVTDVDAVADVDATRTAADGETFEVIEEDVQIGKREVEDGGVRVESVVTETPVEEQVTLREERVNVERRPVDRAVTDGDHAFEEKSVEVSERHEEAVVAKEARVVEEVAIGKEVEEHTETVRETVRRQDVNIVDLGTQHVERYAEDERYRGREFDDVEPDLRREWERDNKDVTWDDARDDVRGFWDRVLGK